MTAATTGLPLILIAWAVAGGSPGPATLAISGSAMALGRRAALLLAAGVVCGSASWGIAAALGLSAMMLTHAWLFEALRYVGAAYLGFLALKSLRAAWYGKALEITAPKSPEHLFAKGLALHLTNPKAILSWGAVYAVALPANAGMAQVWALFAALIAVSMLVFFGYALLFSTGWMARGYAAAKRGFDLAFGLLFGAAAVKIFSTRIDSAG